MTLTGLASDVAVAMLNEPDWGQNAMASCRALHALKETKQNGGLKVPG